MFLKLIKLNKEEIPSFETYPFSIPAISHLDELKIKSPVTFFAGENGSGKSTLMEAIAYQCGFNTAGGSHHLYETRSSQSDLGKYIKLAWMPKVKNGFFLRAESFYQFASYLEELNEEPLSGDVFGPYGGKSLHHQSHGESFLSLFLNRFGNGQKAVYLLDEPEAALSPSRQLTLLRIIHDLTKDGEAQFIIATHSPILLGFPGANILSFDSESIAEIDYTETDHYQITKYFLENRNLFLEELFKEE
ncbi:AAA family ATPase [Metabacillus hrfriensis]|uniref:AAA family ATPase n=1 Tax=Metabacillus hrfriensis TaxID=3048891 RepID=A0ACD4RA30_9BACI|nr:AAA family ATPase [Metabacillus sp. CT-WN-B3]WHZ57318.1 AAA family ATPase [Metabacillus sp. CT-WN-B3]